MKKILISLTILLIHSIVLSQEKSEFQVLDSITKEPVLFPAIKFLSSEGGFYADEEGKFSITEAVDSFMIIHMAYIPKIIKVKSIVENKILLSPNTFQLQEVVVTPEVNKKKLQKIGYDEFKSNIYHGNIRGNFIAVYIPNELPKNEIYQVIKLNIPIRNFSRAAKGYPLVDGHFRVYLYEVDSMKPGNSIVLDDMVYLSSTVKNNFTVDISSYKLQFPDNGIFLGIEWLGTGPDCNKSSNPSIFLTNKLNKQVTWIKDIFTKNQWKLLDDSHPIKSFYPDEFLNACFGISVVKVK